MRFEFVFNKKKINLFEFKISSKSKSNSNFLSKHVYKVGLRLTELVHFFMKIGWDRFVQVTLSNQV